MVDSLRERAVISEERAPPALNVQREVSKGGIGDQQAWSNRLYYCFAGIKVQLKNPSRCQLPSISCSRMAPMLTSDVSVCTARGAEGSGWKRVAASDRVCRQGVLGSLGNRIVR